MSFAISLSSQNGTMDENLALPLNHPIFEADSLFTSKSMKKKVYDFVPVES